MVEEQRESMLKEKFWGDVQRRGSRIMRHSGNAQSAQALVSQLTDDDKFVVLDIQPEMIDDGLKLDKTEAGQFLQKDLVETRQKFERELTDAKEALEDAKNEKDKELIAQLSKQQDEYIAQFKVTTENQSSLQVNFQDLIQDKSQEYVTLATEIATEKQTRADEMRFIRQNLAELQNSIERQEKEHKAEITKIIRSQRAKSAEGINKIESIREQ